MEKKNSWKWICIGLVSGVAFLCGIMEKPSYAASFSSLKEAKMAAWDKLFPEEQSAVESNRETSSNNEIQVSGAVGEDGRAKVIINNWYNKAVPKEEEVSVYSGAGSGGAIGEIYQDTIVEVVETGYEWIKIQSGKLSGYVEAKAMLQGTEAEKQAAVVCPHQILSNVTNTVVRKTADPEGVVIEYMLQRQTYPVLEIIGDWFYVSISDDKKGYVNVKDVIEVRTVRMGTNLEDLDNPQFPYKEEKLNEEERRLLAAIIYCESRGEDFEGQIAVGSVVMNRVHSEKFPNTVGEVIYQTGQFEPVLRGVYASVLANDSVITQSCYEAADVVIQGGNNIGDALYFGYGNYGEEIGTHWFH